MQSREKRQPRKYKTTATDFTIYEVDCSKWRCCWFCCLFFFCPPHSANHISNIDHKKLNEMCSNEGNGEKTKKIQFQALIVHKLKVKRRTFFSSFHTWSSVWNIQETDNFKLAFCISRELKQIIIFAIFDLHCRDAVAAHTIQILSNSICEKLVTSFIFDAVAVFVFIFNVACEYMFHFRFDWLILNVTLEQNYDTGVAFSACI